MVNVPPIPPLLCSTPPPIDFGENDEVDDMQPTLDGVADDEFGDFLTVDDTQIQEPLPSPRPPSVSDIPPVSIFDGLIPTDEEDIKRLSPLSANNDEINKESTKSTNINEAFNFNIRNTNDVECKYLTIEPQTTQKGYKTLEVELIQNIQESLDAEPNTLSPNSYDKCLEITNTLDISSLSKNLEDLKFESSTVDIKINSNETNRNCMQNMVSIEDLEDDLSDDELYSPKTSKNFVEADNLNDYFIIEEIKTPNNAENEQKTLTNDMDIKSLDSLDNNKSDSLGSDIVYKSFSTNSFVQINFDMPPLLQDDTANNIHNDDFEDFADFQDFSFAITPAESQKFVNNTVPVNDNKHHNLTNFNTRKDFEDVNITENYLEQYSNVAKELSNSKNLEDIEDEFDQFTYRTSVSDARFKENTKNSIELEITSQENSKENFTKVKKITEDYKEISTLKENVSPLEESFNKDNNFGAFNSVPETFDHDDFGSFAEFSKTAEDFENENDNPTEIVEYAIEVAKTHASDDDGFDDFTNFETHQDDDDDFGDFNTAQPIAPTASIITQIETSQNTTPAKSAIPSTINLNERISKILQLMFTPASKPTNDTANDNDDDPKTKNKIQDIPFTSIDAAKALEYQWLNSDTRHSYIRSLGIDSRNILFGENWNPSLPRFAANLSFNPLKPMKPVQCTSSLADSSSKLEPLPINTTESSKSLEVSGGNNKEPLDLDWKSPNTSEQTTEAFKENNLNPTVISTATTTLPYVSNEPPPTEPVSLTIFKNTLDSDEKFSKTPPLSEMESVSPFSSQLAKPTMDIELPTTQINNNVDEFILKDDEENLKNTLNINEVVVTSTFTGSFKETHIYTPPKTLETETKHITTTAVSSPTKASHIDFDYEKAAMGVIINETVVKKEYRDVEYNSPFTMESLSKSQNTNKTDIFDSNTYTSNNASILNAADIKVTLETNAIEEDEKESNDDFSEFQSVTSEVSVPTKFLDVPKSTTIAHGGMILSPAILIPQAISMENQKPKIEWGDSTASINPEELARIEELFPEPKSLKSSNGSNSSQKSTPTHQVASTPSISAAVANKELEGNINNLSNDDDDDWSDFVSVTVTNNPPTNRSVSNNNVVTKSPTGSPFKQRSPVLTHKMPPPTLHNNSNNDDEWSDFVSSAPPSQQPASYRIPQFNSGAWQNANFYNNPLSMYHKGPFNVYTSVAAQKSLYNNNNNYNSSQQLNQIANNTPPVVLSNNLEQLPRNVYQQQQQIHVMQNFSTAPVPTPERLTAAVAASKNNQFQSIGSAKVAPSIALIPDLGFVAPAIPTHTSFINSLPKPSINTKK